MAVPAAARLARNVRSKRYPASRAGTCEVAPASAVLLAHLGGAVLAFVIVVRVCFHDPALVTLVSALEDDLWRRNTH